MLQFHSLEQQITVNRENVLVLYKMVGVLPVIIIVKLRFEMPLAQGNLNLQEIKLLLASSELAAGHRWETVACVIFSFAQRSIGLN